MADFDNSVIQIRAQPFQMMARVDGRAVSHIPDYWLLREGVPPVVVAVKPAAMLEDPKINATFRWVREEIESKGWKFEIASEQPAAQLVNVRFLAGFRRPETISVPVLEALRCLHVDELSFGEATRLTASPEPLVRAALLHMLWRHELDADLSVVMSSKTMLHKAVAGGTGWRLLGDSFAIGMILLGISGLLLWARNRTPKQMILSVFGASLVATLLVLVPNLL